MRLLHSTTCRLWVIAFLSYQLFFTTFVAASQFDPAIHIDPSEIKRGMRGYGLTVFQGTKIERFDVEVVSVMKNFQPGRDAILIMCDDPRFDLAKGVQGVSGSPVFFNERLAGAMAFGWPYGVQPLYGVTPIRQMLDVQKTGIASKKSLESDRRASMTFDKSYYENLMRETLLTKEDLTRVAKAAGLIKSDLHLNQSKGPVSLLSPSLTVNGLNSQALAVFQEAIPGLSLATGLSAGSGDEGNSEVTLERGSAITVPLITGDLNSAVLGTVTEVIDGNVYAFGHAWNSTGQSAWPMATGYIHTFVNRNNISFKLGTAMNVVGSLLADETAAVYGQVGDKVDMTPVTIEMRWDYIDTVKTFEMQIAQDDSIGAMLAAVSVVNSLLYRGQMPTVHSLKYEGRVEFDRGPALTYSNMSSGAGVQDFVIDMLQPLSIISLNPYEKVRITKVDFRVTMTDQDSLHYIKNMDLARQVYAPGETIHAKMTLEPLREPEYVKTFSLSLPKDLKEGKYKINVGSYLNYMSDLQKTQPQKFRAYDLEGIQRVMQERLNITRNGLYMTMALPKDSIMIEGETFNHLPPTRAMLLDNTSRAKDGVVFGSLLTAHHPTDYLVMGKATFDIVVKED